MMVAFFNLNITLQLAYLRWVAEHPDWVYLKDGNYPQAPWDANPKTERTGERTDEDDDTGEEGTQGDPIVCI